jgi:hypothetical protein
MCVSFDGSGYDDVWHTFVVSRDLVSFYDTYVEPIVEMHHVSKIDIDTFSKDNTIVFELEKHVSIFERKIVLNDIEPFLRLIEFVATFVFDKQVSSRHDIWLINVRSTYILTNVYRLQP